MQLPSPLHVFGCRSWIPTNAEGGDHNPGVIPPATVRRHGALDFDAFLHKDVGFGVIVGLLFVRGRGLRLPF